MSHQKGFSVVEIIITILFVGLLSFIGWKLYDAQQQKDQDAQQSTTNQDEYLHVKELGLKIKLTDDIKDLSYIASTGEIPGAKLSSVSLAAKDERCGTDFGPLGAIGKTKNALDQNGSAWVVDNKRVFKIGEYFIFWTAPQSVCSLNADTEAYAQRQRTALLNALPTIELDQ